MTHLLAIPDEIMMNICCYLRARDLLSLSLANRFLFAILSGITSCRQLRCFASDEELWEIVFRSTWNQEYKVLSRTREKPPKRLISSSIVAYEVRQRISFWRSQAKKRLEADFSWRNGRPFVSELKGHISAVLCTHLDDGCFVSGLSAGEWFWLKHVGSTDATAKLWDTDSGKCLQTIAFAGRSITALYLSTVSKTIIAATSGIARIAETD